MTVGSKAMLSAQQIAVVNHVDGPILVVAGPGSGKTRVLTERIRRLLSIEGGHFRVLALTFTNKAADEMKQRLADLGEDRERAFIGTLHGFCLDVLQERGKAVGVDGTPHIFEHVQDRRDVLLQAIRNDPFLSERVAAIADSAERSRQIDSWLTMVSRIKTHPVTCAVIDDDESQKVFDAYESGMRACNAYDFDDLLLLACRLFVENPKIGNIYRKLYRFICVDEAQDMNEAQYAVIQAICSDAHRNVMLVGDPRQSIYGFTMSGPEYMEQFGAEFEAERTELTANFRSSRAVVEFAQSLDRDYMVDQQLPVRGAVGVLRCANEDDEANRVCSELERLIRDGHPDVEGGIRSGSCAVLGRTRFALLSIEKVFIERGMQCYKRVTSRHENESDAIEEFLLALRVLSNPQDKLHLAAIIKRWKVDAPSLSESVPSTIERLAHAAAYPRAEAVAAAIVAVAQNSSRFDLMPAMESLVRFADSLEETERLAIYEDVVVLRQEWDHFLRSTTGAKNLSAFLGSKAVGRTQKSSQDGVALLTVHSAKGLEFDVVFVAGMAEGTFPDYRSTSGDAAAEEVRNAFVAATRSRRLLYLSYPETRVMPWGGVRHQQPSRFLSGAAVIP